MTQPTHDSELTDVYPEATEGRVKTSNTPLPEKSKIISKNIDGSLEYERFKQNTREAQAVKIEDNLFGRIVFFVVGIFALSFADRLYGWALPIISYILKAVVAIFISLLLYYTVRLIQISRASKRYKKSRKDQTKSPNL